MEPYWRIHWKSKAPTSFWCQIWYSLPIHAYQIPRMVLVGDFVQRLTEHSRRCFWSTEVGEILATEDLADEGYESDCGEHEGNGEDSHGGGRVADSYRS